MPKHHHLLSLPLSPTAFVTDNNALIFEEHQICDNASLSSTLLTLENGGVFVEDENRFFFCNVLVGHQAKARFKISNIGKIACDVNIVVKPVSSKVRCPGSAGSSLGPIGDWPTRQCGRGCPAYTLRESWITRKVKCGSLSDPAMHKAPCQLCTVASSPPPD